MSGYWFALVLVVIVLATILQLLRTRRLREKYATAWLTVAAVVIVLAIFPGLLSRLASLVGVATPVNLLFALGGVVLLVVAIQFSVEISALEAETRTLAEDLALVGFDLRTLSARLEAIEGRTRGAEPGGGPADATPQTGGRAPESEAGRR